MYWHLATVVPCFVIGTVLLLIQKGNIKAHKRKMILLYFGAILIAGGFTFTPGRYLHELFF
tara:strand:+ start:46502 stop:46684 length:183 start_codon:yes stop_codon:yes gene_type:complete